MLQNFETWREKRRNRAAYRQLSLLSDQMLWDVGLTRGDLDSLRLGQAIWSNRL